MPGIDRVETTADAGAFWERVAPLLLRDPVVNGVLLINVAARRDGAVADPAPATYAAVLDHAGAAVGAAMRTPPFGVVLSAMPEAAAAPLAAAIAPTCPDAIGVSGPAAAADAFANAWAALTGARHEVERRGRLYRLDRVTPPRTAPGAWRAADASDRGPLVAWWEAFEIEMGLGLSGAAGREVDHHLGGRGAFLWVDGEPVSCAFTAPPAGGVVRVGPVYTPPERRRSGYASALVGAASQAALDGGAAACALYTDEANAAGGTIYVALGYRPVADIVAHRFASG